MSGRRKGGSSSSSSSGKGTSISLSFDSNLRSSLAHLPPSMYHALVGRDIPPQSLVLQVIRNGGSTATEADQDSDDDDESGDKNTKPRNTIYLGWSGQCSNVEYTLTLSASLKSLFEPSAAADDKASYTLTLLRSPPLPTATRVDLTPLTPDDWELLSQNAGAVEDNMLSQVRGLHRGARVCIFVGRGGSQECWFRVDSTEPQTTKASTGTKSLPRAVRLVNDTEIVIAPKVRQSQAEAIAKEQHAIGGGPSTSGPSQSVNSKLAARTALKYRIYKVSPANAKPIKSDQEYDLDGDTPVAIISGAQDSEEWSLLSTAFASSSASTSWVKATIHIQACPSAPAIRPWSTDEQSDDSQGTSASSSSHQPTTTAFVLHSTSPQESRWVWFNTALKKKLGGRVGLGETFW